MAKFSMQISGGRQGQVEIDALNAHVAINDALNALSKFASRRFPPPKGVSIDVLDEGGKRLATLKFSFEIEYCDQLLV